MRRTVTLLLAMLLMAAMLAVMALPAIAAHGAAHGGHPCGGPGLRPIVEKGVLVGCIPTGPQKQP